MYDGFIRCRSEYIFGGLAGGYRWFQKTQPWRYWLSGFEVLDLLDDTTVRLRENCARLLLLDAVALVADLPTFW